MECWNKWTNPFSFLANYPKYTPYREWVILFLSPGQREDVSGCPLQKERVSEPVHVWLLRTHLLLGPEYPGCQVQIPSAFPEPSHLARCEKIPVSLFREIKVDSTVSSCFSVSDEFLKTSFPSQQIICFLIDKCNHNGHSCFWGTYLEKRHLCVRLSK